MKKLTKLKKISWKEFHDNGFIWLINQFLHIFGLAIVIEYDKEEVKDVYPARTTFRGFSEVTQMNGYQKISKYLKQNSKDLLDEATEKKNFFEVEVEEEVEESEQPDYLYIFIYKDTTSKPAKIIDFAIFDNVEKMNEFMKKYFKMNFVSEDYSKVLYRSDLDETIYMTIRKVQMNEIYSSHGAARGYHDFNDFYFDFSSNE